MSTETKERVVVRSTRTTERVEERMIELEKEHKVVSNELSFQLDPRLFAEMYQHLPSKQGDQVLKIMPDILRTLMIDAGRSKYAMSLTNRQRHELVRTMVSHYVLNVEDHLRGEMTHMVDNMIDTMFHLSAAKENVFVLARTVQRCFGC
jgi:hypothetical protein